MIPARLAARCVLPLLWLVIGSATTVHAEVGVNDRFASKPSPYIVGIIVDDPDPIGLRWQRYTPAGTPGRIVLNEEGFANGDGPPSILFNPTSDLPVAAWSLNSAAGYDVVVSHFSSGEWTEPEVLAGSSLDELDPALTVDPSDGTVHLFYWVNDVTPRVMHRQAPADLSSWTPPVQVSSAADAACRPAGAVHAGVLRVAYEVHDFGPGETPRNVVLARRDPITGDFIEEVMAVSHHTGSLWPRVHSHQGRTWVDWVDSDLEIAWIRLDLQGQWEATRYEPYATKEERDWLVRGGIRLKAVTLP